MVLYGWNIIVLDRQWIWAERDDEFGLKGVYEEEFRETGGGI